MSHSSKPSGAGAAEEPSFCTPPRTSRNETSTIHYTNNDRRNTPSTDKLLAQRRATRSQLPSSASSSLPHHTGEDARDHSPRVPQPVGSSPLSSDEVIDAGDGEREDAATPVLSQSKAPFPDGCRPSSSTSPCGAEESSHDARRQPNQPAPSSSSSSRSSGSEGGAAGSQRSPAILLTAPERRRCLQQQQHPQHPAGMSLGTDAPVSLRDEDQHAQQQQQQQLQHSGVSAENASEAQVHSEEWRAQVSSAETTTPTRIPSPAAEALPTIIALDHPVLQFLSSADLQGYAGRVIRDLGLDTMDALLAAAMSAQAVPALLGPHAARQHTEQLWAHLERYRTAARVNSRKRAREERAREQQRLRELRERKKEEAAAAKGRHRQQQQQLLLLPLRQQQREEKHSNGKNDCEKPTACNNVTSAAAATGTHSTLSMEALRLLFEDEGLDALRPAEEEGEQRPHVNVPLSDLPAEDPNDKRGGNALVAGASSSSLGDIAALIDGAASPDDFSRFTENASQWMSELAYRRDRHGGRQPHDRTEAAAAAPAAKEVVVVDVDDVSSDRSDGERRRASDRTPPRKSRRLEDQDVTALWKAAAAAASSPDARTTASHSTCWSVSALGSVARNGDAPDDDDSEWVRAAAVDAHADTYNNNISNNNEEEEEEESHRPLMGHDNSATTALAAVSSASVGSTVRHWPAVSLHALAASATIAKAPSPPPPALRASSYGPPHAQVEDDDTPSQQHAATPPPAHDMSALARLQADVNELIARYNSSRGDDTSEVDGPAVYAVLHVRDGEVPAEAPSALPFARIECTARQRQVQTDFSVTGLNAQHEDLHPSAAARVLCGADTAQTIVVSSESHASRTEETSSRHRATAAAAAPAVDEPSPQNGGDSASASGTVALNNPPADPTTSSSPADLAPNEHFVAWDSYGLEAVMKHQTQLSYRKEVPQNAEGSELTHGNRSQSSCPPARPLSSPAPHPVTPTESAAPIDVDVELDGSDDALASNHADQDAEGDGRKEENARVAHPHVESQAAAAGSERIGVNDGNDEEAALFAAPANVRSHQTPLVTAADAASPGAPSQALERLVTLYAEEPSLSNISGIAELQRWCRLLGLPVLEAAAAEPTTLGDTHRADGVSSGAVRSADGDDGEEAEIEIRDGGDCYEDELACFGLDSLVSQTPDATVAMGPTAQEGEEEEEGKEQTPTMMRERLATTTNGVGGASPTPRCSIVPADSAADGPLFALDTTSASFICAQPTHRSESTARSRSPAIGGAADGGENEEEDQECEVFVRQSLQRRQRHAAERRMRASLVAIAAQATFQTRVVPYFTHRLTEFSGLPYQQLRVADCVKALTKLAGGGGSAGRPPALDEAEKKRIKAEATAAEKLETHRCVVAALAAEALQHVEQTAHEYTREHQRKHAQGLGANNELGMASPPPASSPHTHAHPDDSIFDAGDSNLSPPPHTMTGERHNAAGTVAYGNAATHDDDGGASLTSYERVLLLEPVNADAAFAATQRHFPFISGTRLRQLLEASDIPLDCRPSPTPPSSPLPPFAAGGGGGGDLSALSQLFSSPNGGINNNATPCGGGGGGDGGSDGGSTQPLDDGRSLSHSPSPQQQQQQQQLLGPVGEPSPSPARSRTRSMSGSPAPFASQEERRREQTRKFFAQHGLRSRGGWMGGRGRRGGGGGWRGGGARGRGNRAV